MKSRSATIKELVRTIPERTVRGRMVSPTMRARVDPTAVTVVASTLVEIPAEASEPMSREGGYASELALLDGQEWA